MTKEAAASGSTTLVNPTRTNSPQKEVERLTLMHRKKDQFQTLMRGSDDGKYNSMGIKADG
jgi:hypothetical protein